MAPPTAAAGDTSAADKALCEGIAALMVESDRMSNAWTSSGDTGTPERDAALPGFVAATESWVPRIQSVLDEHTDAQPFFRRTLQRYIDDRRLLVANIRPGPSTSYDRTLWADSLGAYGGPLSICQKLGVKW
jgi:hypothetical protein